MSDIFRHRSNLWRLVVPRMRFSEESPMKNLLLIINPCAGQRKANKVLPEIIRIFLDEGYRCETYVTSAAGDATGYVA